jgi:CubicO group peptidase (beta-lactamase class C family)
MSAGPFPTTDWPQGSVGGDVHEPALREACRLIEERPSEEGATHALLVVHGGKVVHEFYGEGVNQDSTLISWSMAKSMTQALVGIAVKDGLLNISDSHLLAQWESDGRRDITLDDLLTMRSGLSWIEDYVDGSTSDVIEMLFAESEFTGDHASYAASKPLLHAPGTQWLYSSGTTNIIARVLANALNEPTGSHQLFKSFMQTRLFDEIGMNSAIAKFDDAGTFVGSSFVYATARDFARFGYLYLNDGVWNGTRLLPEGWVEYAGRVVAHDPDMLMDYGAQWWVWPDDEDSIMAHGYEGQILWVSPRRDLVIVHCGKTDALYGAQLRSMVAGLVEAFPVR